MTTPEDVNGVILVFLLLTLKITHFSSVSIIDLVQVNVSWVETNVPRV